MNGKRSIKRNEANWPVRKSIRIRKEAAAPKAPVAVDPRIYDSDIDWSLWLMSA